MTTERETLIEFIFNAMRNLYKHNPKIDDFIYIKMFRWDDSHLPVSESLFDGYVFDRPKNTNGLIILEYIDTKTLIQLKLTLL
ncbi:MAG: hypothetical protein DRG78_00535 [Epsilonproteobacteria bacterium]|nr:MAG: hypothetical protein DRG78_00535 [Campylobacterota bacterium]